LPPLILIADDSPTIRGFVRLVLRSLTAPFELIEVEDGAQAIAAARNAPPALALIDLHMPGTDGLAALRAMRADEDVRLRDLPIFLLTAERDEATREACVAAGATGFIDKPIKPGVLIETVRRLLAPTDAP
jgi:CheY-like chemotaxis protein